MAAPHIVLEDVVVTHHIPVRTQWGVTHVFIFYDLITHKSYAWRTTSPSAPFHLWGHYDIEALLEPTTNDLSRVKMLKDLNDDATRADPVHTEPQHPDAQDVLLGLAKYE